MDIKNIELYALFEMKTLKGVVRQVSGGVFGFNLVERGDSSFLSMW